MKKRIITLVLSALAVVLLVGVGFASWVVSQGAGSEQKGNILVETVKDERLAVTVGAPSGAFQFGAPAGATKEGKWLFEDNDNAVEENLEVSFLVTVTRPTEFALDGNQPAGLTLSAVLGDKILASATDETGIDYPTKFFAPAAVATRYGVNVADADNAANSDSKWNLSEDKKTATTTVVVALQWGSLFNAENPYVYFNAQTVSAKIGETVANAAGLDEITADSTWGDLAVKALEAVLAYNDYLFKLTINVNVA